MEKHIIITGSRGSGKTTLLKNIVLKIAEGKSLPGIVTWCEPGEAVCMRKLGDEEYAVIGRFNPERNSLVNRMEPVISGFEGYGIDSLEQLIMDESEWVVIDEIGYLEASSTRYLEMLDKVFDTKRVVAVVRKQNLEHIDNLLKRDDVRIIDLDDGN